MMKRMYFWFCIIGGLLGIINISLGVRGIYLDRPVWVTIFSVVIGILSSGMGVYFYIKYINEMS